MVIVTSYFDNRTNPIDCRLNNIVESFHFFKRFLKSNDNFPDVVSNIGLLVSFNQPKVLISAA